MEAKYEDKLVVVYDIINNFVVEHGLVGVILEKCLELIKFAINHGKEYKIVPPNPQLTDKIN